MIVWTTSSMEDYSFLFKIVLIGNAGVGKTCLVRQFTQGKFPTRQGATIGVDFLIKPVVVKGIRVNMQLWDTAGQERFRAITQSYYRSAHCLVLVYDISSQPSFDSLPQWCRDIEQYTDSSNANSNSATGNSNQTLRVLVGNKCDKEREIPESVAAHFAERNGFDLFLETSALHLDNVDKLFSDIAEVLVERKLESMPKGMSSQQNNNQGISLKSLMAGGGGHSEKDGDEKKKPCCSV